VESVVTKMARKVNEIVSAGIAQKMSLQGGEGFHMHPPADETRNGFMTVEDRKTMSGATPSPTPNTLMKRNSSGRAKVTEPVDEDDIARKKEVDVVNDTISKHTTSTSAHPAQNITYGGNVVGANNVKQGLDMLKDRVDNIVSQAGDDNTEIKDARGGFPVLSARLDSSDVRLEDLAYNVKKFGALGDNSTDDTTAIQVTVDACGAAGGGVVYFPPGRYLSGLVKVKYSNVYLVGAGIGATKLIMKPLNDSALIQLGDYADESIRGTLSHIGVSDMEIYGNKEKQSQSADPESGAAIGLRTEDVKNITIKRIKVYDCDGYGVGCVGSGLPNRQNLIIEDVETYNNNYDGIDIKLGFERVWVNRVHSYNNGNPIVPGRQGHGIDVRGEYVSVTNCVTYGNNDSGINIRELYALKLVSVENLKSYGNKVDGAAITGAEVGEYIFTGCHLFGNNRHGASVENGVAYFNDCVINENTSQGIWMKTDAKCSVFVNGGSLSLNVQDGASSLNNNVLSIVGTSVKKNGRRGISISGSTRVSIQHAVIEGNGTANRNNGVGIAVIDQIGIWSIQNAFIYDEKSLANDKLQRRGIQFSGTNVAGTILGNNITGNWESNVYSTIPVGSVVDNNIGFLVGSATLDPTSLTDGAGVTLTISVPGALAGDCAMVAAPYDLQSITVTSYVSATNIVSIRIQNESGATVDLSAGTWKVKVIKW
jgi:hypothetical protein